MAFQKCIVHFDDGRSVPIETKSRDRLAVENQGIDLRLIGPFRASYLLAFATLQRYQRLGVLDGDLPASAEALADVADLEPVEEPDA
jgi:hypothetical protein